jgi:mxaJ protein
MKPAVLAACILLLAAPAVQAGELRVCADPNNLPFSNRVEQGFENKIAEMVARTLGETVRYTWWAQRRGYARNTLKGDLCDLWPGVAIGVEMLATTRPYYRSTYVFVTRTDRHLHIASFDDPRLRQLTIGVQMIGNDAQNTPPTHALARRGIVDNVRGYLIYGDYRTANPPAAIIDAVARGDVDVAVVWGPLAGYFAQQQGGLDITPVEPAFDGPHWPMAFDIAMGVRRGEPAFKAKVEAALAADSAEIAGILAEYHVPLVAARPLR